MLVLATLFLLVGESLAIADLTDDSVSGNATWVQVGKTKLANESIAKLFIGTKEQPTLGQIDFDFNFIGICKDFICDLTWNNDKSLGEKNARMCKFSEDNPHGIIQVNNIYCNKSDFPENAQFRRIPWVFPVKLFACPEQVTLSVVCQAVWEGGWSTSNAFHTTFTFLTCGTYDDK